MEQKRCIELLRWYEDHLKQVILPFWFNRAMDYEHGGYYTCFDIFGQHLLSTDKYVWSQGRFLWVLSKLAEMYPHESKYLKAADMGSEFLMNHCFLPNGNCAFLLSNAGEPKEPVVGGGYDISINADNFVIMGLSKYAEVTGKRDILEQAYTQYMQVCRRLLTKDYRTEPYPVPSGYKAHGVSMIGLNTSQTLLKALRKFHDPRAEEIGEQCAVYAAETMEHFVKGDCLLEMIGGDNQPIDSILGTYVNPGHTIESMWFILHHAIDTGNRAMIDKALVLAKNAYALGWDKTYGGLFQYVHKDGGKPLGDDAGIKDEAMVEKVKNNWDNKLWWVHSEALYTFLLAYKITDNPEYLDIHDVIFKYTFDTFPNPQKSIGEWVQIRDRQGKPESKVMALPVKDPYHVTRNLLLLVELLINWEEVTIL